MTEQRNGIILLRGSRPEGGPRNGLPERSGLGYQYRGHPGWYPEQGVHRDPEEVAPKPDELRRSGAAAQRGGREARVAECARLLAEDPRRTQEKIAGLMGVSAASVKKYVRKLRDRGVIR